MKAVVFHGVGDIRVDDVRDPEILMPTDAIVKLTSTAICGTDLHFVRGTMPGVEPGSVLGHEGVGVVEEVGTHVRNLRPGDRVVISSTIACGYCAYCRGGYFAQCDNANLEGGGTAFFGGGRFAGGYDGLQAEYARIPFAATTLVPLPDEVSDDDAIGLSDIFPTGYFAADMAHVSPGRTVAVFGCGPVGQFAVVSARLMGAGRVFAVDHIPTRLEAAAEQGAEVIDYSREDPVEVLRDLTGGVGPDRVIDAVGVEAERHVEGADRDRYQRELAEIAPERAAGERWQPGNAPTSALEWAVDAVAKEGTLSVVGVYPPSVRWFPTGAAMMKNLRIRMGNCPHRRYIPTLLELVRNGSVDPGQVLSHVGPLVSAVEAYEAFDERKPGWVKVELDPTAPMLV